MSPPQLVPFGASCATCRLRRAFSLSVPHVHGLVEAEPVGERKFRCEFGTDPEIEAVVLCELRW